MHRMHHMYDIMHNNVDNHVHNMNNMHRMHIIRHAMHVSIDNMHSITNLLQIPHATRKIQNLLK